MNWEQGPVIRRGSFENRDQTPLKESRGWVQGVSGEGYPVLGSLKRDGAEIRPTSSKTLCSEVAPRTEEGLGTLVGPLRPLLGRPDDPCRRRTVCPGDTPPEGVVHTHRSGCVPVYFPLFMVFPVRTYSDDPPPTPWVPSQLPLVLQCSHGSGTPWTGEGCDSSPDSHCSGPGVFCHGFYPTSLLPFD